MQCEVKQNLLVIFLLLKVNIIVVVCQEGYKYGDTCDQPDWIQIDNPTSTFSILPDKLNYVFTQNVSIQATLTVIYFDANNVNNVLSGVNSTLFTFQNKVVYLTDFTSDFYLVYMQIKNLTLYFYDNEDDPIVITARGDNINVFPQIGKIYTDHIVNSTLVMQSTLGNQTNLILNISYTDFYHRDVLPNILFSMNIISYPTEPPRFNSKLNNVTVSAWGSTIVKISEFSDPDSTNVTLSLALGNPNWVSLIDNQNLELNIAKSGLGIFKPNATIYLQLEDDSGASVLNSFIVSINTSQLIYFGYIYDQNIDYTDTLEINVDTNSNNEVNLVSWDSLSVLKWNSYNISFHLLTISNFTVEDIGKHWVYLTSIDLWNNTIDSNHFNININAINSPYN